MYQGGGGLSNLSVALANIAFALIVEHQHLIKCIRCKEYDRNLREIDRLGCEKMSVLLSSYCKMHL